MRKALRARWLRSSAAGLACAAVLGFLAGRVWHPAAALAGPPDKAPPAATATPETGGRPVALLFQGRVTVSREALGEYLIARHGADKVDMLVNKTIIDHACKERGIDVSAAEIEASLIDDLKGINVNRQQFVDQVLKQYNKTLYEWKHDVIRPKLQLTKLCKMNITVTEDEIKQAFDAEFGPRVEGRIIIWEKGQQKFALTAYEKIRSSDEEFENAARSQAVSSLAATGGRIKPFGRGAGTHPNLEAEAFKLKPGQISTLVETNEGVVCFKLDRMLPPDETAKVDDHRERLSRIVYDKKLSMEVPKQFKALREAASPVVLLKKKEAPDDVDNTYRALMQTGGTAPAKK